MDAAEHLHELVDVTGSLSNDHSAFRLINEINTGMKAQSSSAGTVNDQRISRAIIKAVHGFQLTGIPSLIFRFLADYRLATVVIIQNVIAACDLTHALTGSLQPLSNPVDRGDWSIDLQTLDQCRRFLVLNQCLFADVLIFDKDSLDDFVRFRIFNSHLTGAIEILQQQVFESPINRVADVQPVPLHHLFQLGLHRHRQRNDWLLLVLPLLVQ